MIGRLIALALAVLVLLAIVIVLRHVGFYEWVDG